MTAHDPKLPHQISDLDVAIAAGVKECIGALFDAKARQRIADALLAGWIVSEDAMQLLITLDLIEHAPEISDE